MAAARGGGGPVPSRLRGGGARAARPGLPAAPRPPGPPVVPGPRRAAALPWAAMLGRGLAAPEGVRGSRGPGAGGAGPYPCGVCCEAAVGGPLSRGTGLM